VAGERQAAALGRGVDFQQGITVGPTDESVIVRLASLGADDVEPAWWLLTTRLL